MTKGRPNITTFSNIQCYYRATENRHDIQKEISGEPYEAGKEVTICCEENGKGWTGKKASINSTHATNCGLALTRPVRSFAL
jgi:hypothetical protein